MNLDIARLGNVLERAASVFAFCAVASMVWLAVVHVYRRVTRAASDVPVACQTAAMIALVLGVYALIGGLGHSGAVVWLAFSEPEYGPVQILRFTTGTMLLYTGAMNIALYRSIRAGRRWAIGMGVATNLLFWLHLFLTLTLPGTGGTVPPPLGVWSVFLVWLGAAAVAIFRSPRRVHASG